ERARRWHRPSVRGADERRLRLLVEGDLPCAVLGDPARGELESAMVFGKKEKERAGRNVEVPLHVPDVEARALVRQAPRLVESAARLDQYALEASFAIRERTPVDFDHVAESQPAVNAFGLDDGEFRDERTRRPCGSLGTLALLRIPLGTD